MAINPDLTGITSGGHALVGHQSGSVFTAFIDANGNGVYDAGTDTSAVFTLTVDPSGGTTGTYTFDLLQPLDGTVVETLIGGSSAFGAGPAQAQLLTANGTGADLAVISGWHVNAGFDFNAWMAGGNPDVALHNVNGSTAGWGVDNNNFTSGEFLRFDFGEPADDFDAGGPYETSGVPGDLPEVSFAKFKLVGYGASEHIYFVVHYTDGTTANVTLTGAALAAAGTTPFEIDAAAGKFIDWIDLYTPDGSGNGKVDLFSVGVTSTNTDVTIPVDMTFTDGDGDSVTGSTTIHVTDGGTATTPNVQQQSVQTQSVSTSSLASSNDNQPSHSHDDRAFAAGRSATLMAALAAVGLEAEHAKLDLHIPAGGMHAPTMAPLHAAAFVAPASAGPSGSVAPTHIVQSALAAASGHAPQAGSHLHDMSPLAHGFGHGEGGHAPTVSELLHGTAPVAHAPTANPGPVMAPAVAMPSAQQLAAAAAAHGPQQSPASVAGPDAQHNQVVSKVLADALHGGEGHGPNIDQLVDSLSGHHGGGSSAIAALASHGGAGVSVGDMSFQMAFGSPHVVPMEEAMHVAAPAHG